MKRLICAILAGALCAGMLVSCSSGAARPGITLNTNPTDWDVSISNANYLKNSLGMEYVYKEGQRDAFRISNRSIVLTHMLQSELVNTISLPDGRVLAENAVDIVAVDTSGREYRSSLARGARVNIFRHGLYYADVQILNVRLADTDGNYLPVYIQRTYHLYADKLHEELTLRANGGTCELASLRLELRAGGRTLKGDGYAAVALSGGGVLGLIAPAGYDSGSASVSESGGAAVASVSAPIGEPITIDEANPFTFGARIIYDESGKAIKAEAATERSPLGSDKIKISGKDSGAEFKGYDALSGSYYINVTGSDFNAAYYNNPQLQPSASVTVTAEDEREIYVTLHTDSGCLEASAIFDKSGDMLPIPVQAGKNFTGENEEPIFDPGDRSYGESVVPIITKKKGDVNFTFIHLYQNWGAFPLKQLSSIQFTAPYYHLSTGVTETTCFNPYYFSETDGSWILPDFRGLSGKMWESQPQFDSAGQTFMIEYIVMGEVRKMRYYRSDINSAGPVYSDVTMHFRSEDGAVEASLRSIEMPQTDENRSWMRLHVTFKDEVNIENGARDFRLIRFNTRYSVFNKYGFLDKNKAFQERSMYGAAYSADALDPESFYIEESHSLAADTPYAAFYDITLNNDQLANIGLAVLSTKIKAGGGSYTKNLTVNARSLPNEGWIGLADEPVTFRSGDEILIDYILMPYGKQIRTADNIKRLYEQYVVKRYGVSSETVKNSVDLGVPVVTAKDNKAAFTLKNGTNNVVVRVEGFKGLALPKITYTLPGGAGGEYILSSGAHDYCDGYQIYVDKNGCYGFAFVIDTSKYAGASFQLVQ